MTDDNKIGDEGETDYDLEDHNHDKNDESLRGFIERLKNGDLEHNVRIILVIGPAGAGKTSLLRLLTGQDLQVGHTLDNGTAIPTSIPATIDGKDYIFIDSPGFGHAASRPGVIKRQIHAMLGHFTRILGGIHGILYVQDIMVERTLPGMQEAATFLSELSSRSIRPQVTFITTKWDIPRSIPKLMGKCEAKEAELIRVTWAGFKIGTTSGSRHFRHGVDGAEDSDQVQQSGRDLLLRDVIAHYRDASAEALVMPFSEWTYMDKGYKIATVTGKVVLVGAEVTFLGFAGFLLACPWILIPFVF